MKKLGLINLILVLVAGCGEFESKDSNPSNTRTTTTIKGSQGEPGKDVKSCSVTKFKGGIEITCPDGTTGVIYDGDNGEKGSKGSKGSPGADGTDSTDPIYMGYSCSRTILRIGGKHYVVHGGLILLTTTWLVISTKCKIRLKHNIIEVDNVKKVKK